MKMEILLASGLKECKYIKKVMIRNILGDLKIFSDDSDESDAEYFFQSNREIKILTKKEKDK